jgi:epsin
MNLSLEGLKEQVSNLSLYDLKAGVRKVQNGAYHHFLPALAATLTFLFIAVMNYTEMEAKVREATNNEPWGCSTTLMQEIANGTYN